MTDTRSLACCIVANFINLPVYNLANTGTLGQPVAWFDLLDPHPEHWCITPKEAKLAFAGQVLTTTHRPSPKEVAKAEAVLLKARTGLRTILDCVDCDFSRFEIRPYLRGLVLYGTFKEQDVAPLAVRFRNVLSSDATMLDVLTAPVEPCKVSDLPREEFESEGQRAYRLRREEEERRVMEEKAKEKAKYAETRQSALEKLTPEERRALGAWS